MAAPVVAIVGGSDAAIERAVESVSGVGATVSSVLAPDGLDGVAAADCVVCVGDGEWTALELLAAARQRRPAVPAVLLAGPGGVDRATAATDDATVVLAAGGGAGDDERLRERVAALLAGRPAPDGGEGGGADRGEDGGAGGGEGRGTDGGEDGGAGGQVTPEGLAVFDRLPDPAIIASDDDEPVVRRVNAAFEETFGFEAAEVVGQPASEVLLPDGEDRDLVAPPDEPEAVVEATVRRRTAEGPREFLLRGRRTTPGGQPAGMVVYTDVTERERRARRVKALHGTTRELLAADDREAIAAVAVEAAGDVLELPAAAVHVLDEDGDRMPPIAYNERVADLFDGPPPPFERGEGSVWEVLATGEPKVVRDVREAADVDPWVPVRSLLILPLGEHGVLLSSSTDPDAFDEQAVDLGRLLAANTAAALDRAAGEAALRERERELRAERDRLATLFETTPIPAVRTEFHGDAPVVREVNPAFEATFGYDADAIRGEDLDEYVVPPDRQTEAARINDAVTSGRSVELEVQRRTADGLRDFLLTVAPGGAADAYVFYVDVTERKQRQQRLRVLSRVLRHDIRNQMNVIAGSAELIVGRSDDPGVVEAAEDVRGAADRLLDLSRKTRAAEGAVAAAADQESVELGRAVRTIADAAADRYPDCAFDVETPDQDVTVARAAVVAVEEAVENAAEHNDAGDPQVTVVVARDGEYARVAVADNGPGVPHSERALVAGEREPTQVDHASGVGLWVLSWIATGVGGDVTFADREPRGTELVLRFPAIGA